MLPAPRARAALLLPQVMLVLMLLLLVLLLLVVLVLLPVLTPVVTPVLTLSLLLPQRRRGGRGQREPPVHGR